MERSFKPNIKCAFNFILIYVLFVPLPAYHFLHLCPLKDILFCLFLHLSTISLNLYNCSVFKC